MIADEQYQKWLNNPRSERVVLFEFADVKFANKSFVGFIDGLPHSFADTMASSFEFDSGLTSSLSVGDVELVNTGRYDSIIDGQYRGEKLTVKWGGPDWDYSDFKLIANLMIDDINPINKQSIRIRFYDQRRILDIPVTVGAINSLTPLAATELLAGQVGLTVSSMLNFSELQSTIRLSADISDTDTVDSVLTSLLEPIGIYHRINLLGELELIVVDHTAEPTGIIKTSNIVADTLQPNEPVQPSSKVLLTWGSDSEISELTGLDETHYDPIEFSTAIDNLSDANLELSRRVALRSVRRTLWSFEVFASSVEFREGDRVTLYHPRFGLSDGKSGTVMRRILQLGNSNRISLEVLI